MNKYIKGNSLYKQWSLGDVAFEMYIALFKVIGVKRIVLRKNVHNNPWKRNRLTF